MTILYIVPSQLEMELLESIANRSDNASKITRFVECGIGPVAAALNTFRLILEHDARNVVLLGIAGTYDSELGVGSAFRVSTVRMFGMGVGTGKKFLPFEQTELKDMVDHPPIITLSTDQGDGVSALTVSAVSANPEEVSEKTAIYPDAQLEDMESFGVAMACRAADKPLTVLRGISNVAGERDKRSWRVRDALESCLKLAFEIQSI